MNESLTAAISHVGDGLICFVTGAGISAASGIPTFRGTDPDAIWNRDITELGTHAFFRADPVGSWTWYLGRFQGLLDARPNRAHSAVTAIERWHLARGGRFLVVTQNIDGLHSAAGSRNVVEVHGSAARARCSRVGCANGAPTGSIDRTSINLEPFEVDPGIETLPRCELCGEILRQHVLWFDEYYTDHQDYQWLRVQTAAATAELVIFVGTSFSVGVTDFFVQQTLAREVPCFSIDPGRQGPELPGLEHLQLRAEECLPEVCKQLGIEAELTAGVKNRGRSR